MKRKSVLICGYYGFANAGDEAMLMAVIEALGDISAELDITVLSGNPEETAARHGVKAIHRMSFFPILKAMLAADLVISGGGSLLQDVTSRRSVFYYLAIMQLAKFLGKPVMLYGQGIGPLTGDLARAATRFVCRQADLITVRDKKSLTVLKELGIDNCPVVFTADPVMAMHPVDRLSGRMLLRAHGMEGAKILVGISVRDWKHLKDFKVVLARVADELICKYDARVVFLPLQYPDDLAVSEEIVGLMAEKRQVAVITERCSISDFLSLVGNMQLLVSIRLHALIFGAVMGVPVLGLSYDPKIGGFLEEISSTPVGALEDVTVERLLERIKEALGNSEVLFRQNACVENLRAQAFKNAELAMGLLRKQ